MGVKSYLDFDTALNEFKRYLLQNGHSKNTINSYIRTIQQTLSRKNLKTITQRDLDDIALSLMSKYQLNGNRTRYAALNLFCKKILGKTNLNLTIPTSEIKNKDVLTNEQVEKILDEAKKEGRAVYTVLQTLYDCALRRGEVCSLDIEDVNFETRELYLRNTKTGNSIVSMTSRVSKAIEEYILYERKSIKTSEKALFLNKYEKRIGEHFIRNNLKECTIKAGITKRVYPHMLRASCITHLLNNGINPLIVQRHARHNSFRTTMIYNRPTQQQMKDDIERIFVKKSVLEDKDREKAVFDKYIKGEITVQEAITLLDVMRPKQLKPSSEFPGYS